MIALNGSAVLVAALAGFFIGFLWHGPVFGSVWLKLMGMKKPDVITPAMKKEMLRSMAIGLISLVVMAYVLDYSIQFAAIALKTSGIVVGLQGAVWNWLGFVLPVTLSQVLWEKRSVKLWAFGAAHYLVVLAAMGIILALWT